MDKPLPLPTLVLPSPQPAAARSSSPYSPDKSSSHLTPSPTPPPSLPTSPLISVTTTPPLWSLPAAERAFVSKVAAQVGKAAAADGKTSVKGSDVVDIVVSVTNVHAREQAVAIAKTLVTNHVINGPAVFQDDVSIAYTLGHSTSNSHLQGFLTSIAPCYSPRCSPEKLCYSTTCPLRNLRTSKLSLSGTSLSRKGSAASNTSSKHDKERKIWSDSIDADTLKKTSKEEIKRQNCISELCNSEDEYTGYLVTLVDVARELLARKDIFPDEGFRKSFVANVFGNISALADVHIKILAGIQERQQQTPTIEAIADVFVKYIDQLEPYLEFCAQSAYGKVVYDREAKKNPLLVAYMHEQQKGRFFKQDLASVINRAITRLGRYNLMLEAIQKATKEHTLSDAFIPAAMEGFKALGVRVNAETGKATNKLKVLSIDELLENKDKLPPLHLDDPERTLFHDGRLSTKESKELNIYMFDHFLLLTKGPAGEPQTIYKHPFRWDKVEVMDETQAEELEKAAVAEGSVAGLAVRGSIRGKKLDPKGTTDRLGVSPLNSPVSKHPPAVPPGPNDATFAVVLADKNLRVIFFKAGNVHEKKTWMEAFAKRIEAARKDSLLYAPKPIGTVPSPKVHCVCEFKDPKQNKTRLLVGTDDGMFTTTFGQDRSNIGFSIVTDMPKIIQIDVLESNRCVVFISDKALYTLSFDAFEAKEKPILVDKSDGTSVIKVGSVMEKEYVAAGKNKFDFTGNSLKLLECKEKTCTSKNTKDRLVKNKKFLFSATIVGFKFLAVKSENFVVIGNPEVHFSIMNYPTSRVNGIPNDHVKQQVGGSAFAINIFRIGTEYLLCYRDVGLFVDKVGKKTKDLVIYWTGTPRSFAVSEPYVIAFSDRFYEVHSVETGELIQIVPVRNLAHLSALSNHDAATTVYALSAGSTINIIDRVNEVAPFKAAGKTMFAMQEDDL